MHIGKFIIFLLLLGKVYSSVHAATQQDVELFKIALIRWQQTKQDTDYHAVMRLYETLHNDTIRPQWLQTGRTIAASYGINIEQLYQAYITPPPPPVCPTPQSQPPATPAPVPEQPSTTPPVIPSPEQPPVPVAPQPQPTPPNPAPEQPIQPEPLPEDPVPEEPTPPVVTPPVIPEPQPPVIPEQPAIPQQPSGPQPTPPIVLPTPVEPPTEPEHPFVTQNAEEEEFCLFDFLTSLLNPVTKKDPEKNFRVFIILRSR